MGGDSRPDPFAGEHGRLVSHELPYPPTHPMGHRAQVAVHGGDSRPTERGPRHTAPAPPPPELGFDLDKWRHMSRAERRAVLRAGRRAVLRYAKRGQR